jgi:hypothetical protein
MFGHGNIQRDARAKDPHEPNIVSPQSPTTGLAP